MSGTENTGVEETNNSSATDTALTFHSIMGEIRLLFI